jgi:hypothetical protein
MRACGCLLAAVVMSILAAPRLAADGDAVDRLVARLASPDFRQREAASRELDHLGDAAIDALRTATQTGDAETRRRATALVDRISRRRVADRVLGPSEVTLRYDQTPLAEAVADLARRTGTPISLHGDAKRFANRTVTVVSGKATFWQALDLFCHRAGLHEWEGLTGLPGEVSGPSGESDQPALSEGVQVLGQMMVRRGQVSALTIPSPAGHVALLDGPGRAVPSHLAGSVRVRALPGFSMPVDVGKDQLLVLGVTAEPRLRIDGATDLRIERAIDERGRSRTVKAVWADPPDEREDWPRGGVRLPPQVTERHSGPVGLRISRDEMPSKRFRELVGVVTVQAFAPQPVVEIAKPAEALRRTTRGAAGVAITVIALEDAGNGETRVRAEVQQPYGVRLDLPLAGPIGVGNRGNGFGRGWAGFQPSDPEPNTVNGDEYQGLTLEDSAGKRWPVATGMTELTGLFEQSFRTRVTATFRPPTPGATPAKLAYLVRQATIVDVPFVLRDVPLP